MKRFLVPAALIFILVFSAGCTTGSYTSIGSVEVNAFSTMSMSYLKFNGHKSTKIHVKAGEPIDVKVNIVTTKGKIGLSIVDEKDKPVYEGKDIPTSDFTVSLEKEGDFTITVKGENHKGKYKISWGKPKQGE